MITAPARLTKLEAFRQRKNCFPITVAEFDRSFFTFNAAADFPIELVRAAVPACPYTNW